jgi:hypothetical protein
MSGITNGVHMLFAVGFVVGACGVVGMLKTGNIVVADKPVMKHTTQMAGKKKVFGRHR